jgi:hypothetical protein
VRFGGLPLSCLSFENKAGERVRSSVGGEALVTRRSGPPGRSMVSDLRRQAFSIPVAALFVAVQKAGAWSGLGNRARRWAAAPRLRLHCSIAAHLSRWRPLRCGQRW